MNTPILVRALACLFTVGQLVGCASLSSDGAPRCDGRERRPANPWGSVLDDPADAIPQSDAALGPPSPSLAPAAEPSAPAAPDRPLKSGGCQ